MDGARDGAIPRALRRLDRGVFRVQRDGRKRCGTKLAAAAVGSRCLCPATAHLQTDECGAFERFSGSKVVPIATADGKLRPQDVEPYLHAGHGVHFPQPRAISISQATEYGGLYERHEIEELCAFAHRRGLLVHVDGARIANAAAALGTTPRALTVDAGVNVLTFGGTKNGMMLGEAICFFEPSLHAGAAPFIQKQAMQLASKMRYVGAQFEPFSTVAAG